MDRKFITHKIKELKEERIKQLNKSLLRDIKKVKDKKKLHERLKGRMKETRYFAKFLNNYFNNTQDFKKSGDFTKSSAEESHNSGLKKDRHS